jgi:glycosyltransferase involved in cell wall biosynthesis
VQEINNPYIGGARAKMLRKALDHDATVIVFLDYDLQWPAGELLKLIETDGDVIAGTYRCKVDEEQYMGTVFNGSRWARDRPGGWLHQGRVLLLRAFSRSRPWPSNC